MALIGMMALSCWLSFIFVDASSPRPSDTPLLQRGEIISQISGVIADQTTINSPSVDSGIEQSHGSASSLFSLSGQDGALNFDQKQQSVEDINVLETLYDKSITQWSGQGDTQILVTLIRHLAANYQFADANKYLKQLMLMPGYEKVLDPNVIISILLQDSSISYETPDSINSLLPLITEYRSEGLLTQDDVSFYQGLIAIRFKKYIDASKDFSTINTVTYQPLIQAYQKALSDFSGSKNTPAYYQDALVGLSMLKNWYFSIAKNLALWAVMQDNDYILPYQILAYANFLSNNFDVSAQYFLKLADFDPVNKQNYIFLVGVSYYRIGDYDQSVLYLDQVTDPSLMSDVYRYELLSYLSANDTDSALRLWQKLLGQSDIGPSDFESFFKAFYYTPYSNGQPFTLYQANEQLASMYQTNCVSMLSSGQQDVCVYGEVWQLLAHQDRTWMADNLLYLSHSYHQTYLFHVLGDYYFQNQQFALAKDAYSQALSICSEPNEETILKDKIAKVGE